MGNRSSCLDVVCGWHCFGGFHLKPYTGHTVGGLSYLLQYAYVMAHAHKHTQACFPNLYLHSALFLTASFTHTYSTYAHTWCFIFVSIFWVLQLPAGLWTPVSLCMANPWGVPAFITRTHTPVAGETHWQSHPSVNLSLSPRQLNISQCKYICARKIFSSCALVVEPQRHSVLLVSRQSWPESGHSFHRQGRRDLALHLHHSACPPGATWPDCSSPPPPPHPPPHPLICMDLHKTKTWLSLQRLPWLKPLRTGSTRPHRTQPL